jgi:hypothetical protein
MVPGTNTTTKMSTYAEAASLPEDNGNRVGIHRANFVDFILDLRNCYSRSRLCPLIEICKI